MQWLLLLSALTMAIPYCLPWVALPPLGTGSGVVVVVTVGGSLFYVRLPLNSPIGRSSPGQLTEKSQKERKKEREGKKV